MKKLTFSTMALACLLVLSGCDQSSNTSGGAGSDTAELATEAQKISYIMGRDIGSSIDVENVEFDIGAFNTGIKEALAGTESRLTEEEVRALVEGYQARLSAAEEAKRKLLSEANLKSGKSFLAEKAKDDSVEVLSSGLHYKIIETGTGARPTEDATVEVHYRGTLIDGTEFDSSYKRGVPAQFGVTQVIPGWVEALQLMKEGAKWELYIPPGLAYGPGGTGGVIGPNQTLIFEVELLDASVEQEGEDDSDKGGD